MSTYEEALSEARAMNQQSVGRFNEALGPVFPRFAPDDMKAMVMFNALREADITGAMAEILRKLESLAPPDRFVNDHSSYIEHLRTQMARAKAMDVAIEAKDLPHVHLEMAELNVASQLILIDVPSEFCNLLDFGGGTGQGGRPPPPQAPSGPGPMPGLCGGLAVPGGEYGESIDGLSRRFSVQFGPRVSFPEGLKPDELLRGLTYVQPAIVDLFERTLAELDAIGPPAEYEVGHQVLHDYFDELRSTAIAIDRAVAKNDHDQVIREFERSGEVSRSAIDRLPENYRPLVRAIFPQSPDQ